MFYFILYFCIPIILTIICPLIYNFGNKKNALILMIFDCLLYLLAFLSIKEIFNYTINYIFIIEIALLLLTSLVIGILKEKNKKIRMIMPIVYVVLVLIFLNILDDVLWNDVIAFFTDDWDFFAIKIIFFWYYIIGLVFIYKNFIYLPVVIILTIGFVINLICCFNFKKTRYKDKNNV